jgi:hypothetical protein
VRAPLSARRAQARRLVTCVCRRSASFIFFVARVERSETRERRWSRTFVPGFRCAQSRLRDQVRKIERQAPPLLSFPQNGFALDVIVFCLRAFARRKTRAPRCAARTGTLAMKVRISWRKKHLPLPRGERDGVRGFGRCKLFWESRTPSSCPSSPSARLRASSTRYGGEGTQRAGRDTPRLSCELPLPCGERESRAVPLCTGPAPSTLPGWFSCVRDT